MRGGICKAELRGARSEKLILPPIDLTAKSLAKRSFRPSPQGSWFSPSCHADGAPSSPCLLRPETQDLFWIGSSFLDVKWNTAGGRRHCVCQIEIGHGPRPPSIHFMALCSSKTSWTLAGPRF